MDRPVDENVICPMMGKPCVGVDNCAPAIMSAVKVEGEWRYACPIVHAVECFSVIANRLIAMTPPGAEDKSVDKLGKEAWIKDIIKPDQMRRE